MASTDPLSPDCAALACVHIHRSLKDKKDKKKILELCRIGELFVKLLLHRFKIINKVFLFSFFLFFNLNLIIRISMPSLYNRKYANKNCKLFLF